jgi:hypothetical protein
MFLEHGVKEPRNKNTGKKLVPTGIRGIFSS